MIGELPLRERLQAPPRHTRSPASLRAAGDAGCQLLIEGTPWREFSWARQAQIGSMGFLMLGPGLHAWYTLLARVFPGTGMAASLKRLAADQLIFAPILISSTLSFLAAVQGHADDIPRRLREQVPGAVLDNWKVRPLTQFVNFTFVPVQHQVLYTNCMAVIWNGYLSWSANRERASRVEASAAAKAAAAAPAPAVAAAPA